MGGSGGNGGRPIGGAGGGGLGPSSEDCNLTFEVNVFGPVPGVAEELSEGDLLDVSLSEDNGATVAVLDAQGRIAGTLAGSARIPKLVACIQQGNEYSAKVLKADGGDIRVIIENR